MRPGLYKQHFGPAMKEIGLDGRFTSVGEARHKNPAITIKVYTHFIRGAEMRRRETIAGLIRSCA